MTSNIEWCDMTANPFHGCLHGCDFCYARRFAKRLGGNPKVPSYYSLVSEDLDPFSPVFSMRDYLALSKRLSSARAPRRVFLGSMGDLGGDWSYRGINDLGKMQQKQIPAGSVRHAIKQLALMHCRHIFLILTKNPGGMASLDWPPNVQVGVSAAYQAEAYCRLEDLLISVNTSTPWISLEPLLDLEFSPADILCTHAGRPAWVVIGAQTGPGAKNTEAHARSALRIVEWCKKVKIPCFVKENMRELLPAQKLPTQLAS